MSRTNAERQRDYRTIELTGKQVGVLLRLYEWQVEWFHPNNDWTRAVDARHARALENRGLAESTPDGFRWRLTHKGREWLAYHIMPAVPAPVQPRPSQVAWFGFHMSRARFYLRESMKISQEMEANKRAPCVRKSLFPIWQQLWKRFQFHSRTCEAIENTMLN